MLTCSICGKSIDHDRLCPYYEQPIAKHYCSVCHQGIYDGEDYIQNNDGECRHYECFYGLRELLEWLGFEIKIMGDTD